ncbi:MAG: succinate dehydrogenase [Chthonomonadales bacterium]
MSLYTAASAEKGRAPVEMGSRTDNWWLAPLAFIIVFGTFVLYTTFRMFENGYYQTADIPGAADLLSPFYSPTLAFNLHINIPILGNKMVSPAIYILIFPLSFRMTCYYYRKAYYRAFFADPAGCAVTEPLSGMRKKYTGERAFPFIVQNLHRYAFYAAAIFILLLGYDTIKAFTFADGRHIGVSVGTLVFLINWVLLTCYTFGCHSWRHLIGGKVDCYSCTALTRTRYGAWQKASFLNDRHALFAWCSMISVGLADVYVNLVARGVITDFRLF